MSKLDKEIKKQKKLLRKLKQKREDQTIEKYLKKIFNLKKGEKLKFKIRNRCNNEDLYAFFKVKKIKNGYNIKSALDNLNQLYLYWEVEATTPSKKEVRNILTEWVNAEQ